VLKGQRHIPVLVSAAVAGVGLAAAGAGIWLGLARGEALRGPVGLGVAGVCALWTGALLGLGWHARRFQRAVTSTVEGLRRGERIESRGGRRADRLTWAIRSLLDRDRQAVRALLAQMEDLRLRTQLLDRQKRHIEAILHSLRDAVIVVDESDRVLIANRVAGHLLGFDYGAAALRPVAELVRSDRGDLVEFLREARTGDARRQIEWRDKEGTAAYDGVACCVRDEQGTPCGVVAVLHDVTRDKEVARLKDDFVSTVSHELKTPLAAITAYAEMLTDSEAADEATRNEFVAVIQGQARRLGRLISDILNIARIESGLAPVSKSPLSLALLVDEQVRMMRAYAEEKQVEVVASGPIVHDQVIADRDMVSLVLVNLLSNAVKYNRPGGSVRAQTEVDEVRGVVCVRVTDTGVGIAPEDMEHLFEKFYRAPAHAGRAEGTGLGLNLVRQIVEKVHGGRVSVHSEVGVGTTFEFELPLAGSPGGALTAGGEEAPVHAQPVLSGADTGCPGGMLEGGAGPDCGPSRWSTDGKAVS